MATVASLWKHLGVEGICDGSEGEARSLLFSTAGVACGDDGAGKVISPRLRGINLVYGLVSNVTLCGWGEFLVHQSPEACNFGSVIITQHMVNNLEMCKG